MFKNKIIYTGCSLCLRSGSIRKYFRHFVKLSLVVVFLLVLVWLSVSQLAAQTGETIDSNVPKNSSTSGLNAEADEQKPRENKKDNKPEVKAEGITGADKVNPDAGIPDIKTEKKKPSSDKSGVKSNTGDESPATAKSVDDTTGVGETKTAAADKNKEISVESGEKNPGKVTESTVSAEKKSEPAGSGAGMNRFLEIRDGDFKYSRIPGITIKKVKPAEKYTEDIQLPGDKAGGENAGISGPGAKDKTVLGMSKDTADIVIKIFLILLIVGLIILFRFRSKSRNNRVLRRFPGA